MSDSSFVEPRSDFLLLAFADFRILEKSPSDMLERSGTKKIEEMLGLNEDITNLQGRFEPTQDVVRILRMVHVVRLSTHFEFVV